jgi:protoporphyrinogen/coproporphyrinogen III oxidase
MENERVAVIGGGPAGLSAAWSLQSAGKRVTLYEARPEVGGKLRSDVLDGAVVDVAVQLLSSTYVSLRRLIEAAGGGHLLAPSPGRDAVWRSGRAHTLTYGSVASLVASGALPATLKLRMGARYLPFLAGRARGLDANDPARTGGATLDDESIAAWGRRELGDDFVELLAYPLLAAYYGSPPERVSAAIYHALAKVGMEVRLYAARDGMGRLAGGIGQALERHGGTVRTSSPVSAVRSTDEGVIVEVAGGEDRHAAAVIAVPAPSALRMVPAELPQRAWLEAVEVVPATTVGLLTSRPIEADYFGLSFPRYTEPGKQIVAACVQRRKGPGFVPPGKGLLVVFPAPEVSARGVSAAPEQVVDWVMPAVERAFPGIGSAIERARVYRFEEGYTVFYPGYVRHVHAADPSPWRRIALAGDYLVAPTVEGAVVSGLRAAERLLAAD